MPLAGQAAGKAEFQAWGSYFGDHRGHGRWGVHFDGQYRTAPDRPWKQTLLRPGVNFYPRKNLFLTQGYAYIDTRTAAVFSPEHRSWQQAQYMPAWKSVTMTHRLRLEQRWLQTATGYRYQNRIRYFYRTELPSKGPYYLALQNEVFYGFGHNHGAAYFDRNRAYIAVGKRFGPLGRIEVGYLYQKALLRDGIREENNHIAVLSFLSAQKLGR